MLQGRRASVPLDRVGRVVGERAAVSGVLLCLLGVLACLPFGVGGGSRAVPVSVLVASAPAWLATLSSLSAPSFLLGNHLARQAAATPNSIAVTGLAVAHILAFGVFVLRNATRPVAPGRLFLLYSRLQLDGH